MASSRPVAVIQAWFLNGNYAVKAVI